MMHSSTVKIRKRHIIRAGDMFYLNNKFKGKLLPKPLYFLQGRCCCRSSGQSDIRAKFLERETDFAFEGILPP